MDLMGGQSEQIFHREDAKKAKARAERQARKQWRFQHAFPSALCGFAALREPDDLLAHAKAQSRKEDAKINFLISIASHFRPQFFLFLIFDFFASSR